MIFFLTIDSSFGMSDIEYTICPEECNVKNHMDLSLHSRSNLNLIYPVQDEYFA